MAKDSKELSEETDKLKIENQTLRQKLKESRESIDAIKTGNIDALVTVHEKGLRIYTDKSADKPYRILIEKMHEGAVTLNEDGRILYCNSYFANLLNLALQKVIGTIFETYLDDPSKVNFRSFLKQSNLNVLKEEVHIIASDGSKIPMLMTLNALQVDSHSMLSIILTDLTLQYENQQKLKSRSNQLEEKNKELENTLKELAFQMEEKGKRAAELSIADKELEFQTSEKKKRAAEFVIAGKELEFQSEEKEKRAVELIAAKTDVKELEGLNIHKENILSTISHDLRSPLAGIIQLAELLKVDFKTMDEQTLQNMLDHMHKLTTEELSMLDYLVEWARIKYAAEAFSPEQIELAQQVKKVFETLHEMAYSNNIHLINEITEDIAVFADGKMVLSILQNIVSNSIKHTPGEGTVTAFAKRKEDKMIIEIKDTGIGMSKEMIEKLFAPQMGTLSNARKENKGAGIGLLLIKGFVDKNGGEIWVESTEGEGTSFYFTLLAEKPLE